MIETSVNLPSLEPGMNLPILTSKSPHVYTLKSKEFFHLHPIPAHSPCASTHFPVPDDLPDLWVNASRSANNDRIAPWTNGAVCGPRELISP